jgi:hypothetical protein
MGHWLKVGDACSWIFLLIINNCIGGKLADKIDEALSEVSDAGS